ncbi:hypothetical protein BU17DRAFT_46223 [Hysterangium stoloniferum]|nr:hypothetical protein BU17DRAFT_46223 [Hysterangium stoloniferum]
MGGCEITFRLVVGTGGQGRSVPKLSSTMPYDPFSVDIYQIGSVIMELVELN